MHPAANGRDAIEAVTEVRPDVIVLDVMLPDLDGFEVCNRLRTTGSRTPVLFLTARAGTDRRWLLLTAALVSPAATGCHRDPPPVRAAPPQLSAFELDHLWIVVPPPAAERSALERAGFQIAAKLNHHAGQGTSSITVELDNGFLELIYPDDTVPVAPALAAVHTRFQQRAAWRTSGQAYHVLS